jgi:HEAT repeat protein
MFTMTCLLAVSLAVQQPRTTTVAETRRALVALDSQLEEVHTALAGTWSSPIDGSPLPPAWNAQDPGDSLYRAARQLLNRGRYAESADAFTQLTKRYPRSSYTPDAYYWAAFALYRTGDTQSYKQALGNLDVQRRRYPHANTVDDGQALEARIQGELARQGDPTAAEWVRLHAASAAVPPTPATPAAPAAAPAPATPPTPGTPATPPSGRSVAQAGCPSEDDDDPRMVALNALLQMDADAAVPILKKVLARRDPCSVALRRKAMFIVSQKRTEGTEDILLAAARTDPDDEVRQQAVFWLSQVGTERAIGALDSILRSSTDLELQKKALFALSQIRGARGGQILRQYALRTDAPVEARAQAIFWLGQQRSADNAAFLRDLYAKLTDQDLKERVIFSLSQMRTEENGRWLMDLALNEREPIDMRKKALFWAGQMGAPMTDLVALYDRTTNDEMKQQLIFVYSQRHTPEALDKLIDIAKRETNPDLRKKAIFWLGQSNDPRARQVLIDIIDQ